MAPASNGESISTAFLAVAQESGAIHFKFFSVHMLSTDLAPLSTGLCTALPQATQRNSAGTNITVAKCNRPIFSSDILQLFNVSVKHNSGRNPVAHSRAQSNASDRGHGPASAPGKPSLIVAHHRPQTSTATP